MNANTASDWVAGVDGCRGGWLGVFRHLAAELPPRVRLFEAFADILGAPEAPCVIAVDIPIGLPRRAVRGGRQCDIEARRVLGDRQSSVFAVPARAAIAERDYAAACEVALARSDPPRKISRQCFNLFAKIREVDALMSPRMQARVFECHPEFAFVEMNDGQALGEPKKVKSRAYKPGLDLRRGLLEGHGFPAALWDVRYPTSKAGADDLLDACACAWTASRIAGGDGRRVPLEPPRDARGLRMEIWC